MTVIGKPSDVTLSATVNMFVTTRLAPVPDLIHAVAPLAVVIEGTVKVLVPVSRRVPPNALMRLMGNE